MAVAQAHREEEWEQWKREMEESRRRRWRNWVKCWTEAEVSPNEEEQADDWSQWEARRAEFDKKELSEEEREDDFEGKIEEEGGGEEAEGRQFAKLWEERRMRKRRAESDVENESDEEMKGKCENEVNQEDGGVGEGHEEANGKERKDNVSKRDDGENDRIIHEIEDIEQDHEEEGVSREIRGDEGLDDNDVEEDGEESKVDEMEENSSRGEVGDEDRSVGIEKEVDHKLDDPDNNSLNTSIEEIRTGMIERREAGNDRCDLEESGKLGEMEAKDVEDMKEEPEEKCGYNDDVDEHMANDDEEDEDEKGVMEVVEGKEVEINQRMCGQQVSGTGNQLSQNGKTQNNPRFSAENHVHGPTEYENGVSSQSHFEDEHLNSVELKKKELGMQESKIKEPSKMENTFQQEWRCSGREEKEVQSDRKAAEMLQDDDFGPQEKEEDDKEESTEEEECSAEEGEGTFEEDVVKVYRKDNFVIDLFGTLNEFRHSSVLTDLILTTVNGKRLHVHSAVMAAVSTYIRSTLSPRDEENIPAGHCGERRLTRRSVALSPDVDHVGLDAVVEFAYTGLITCPHVDTIRRIKNAAESLGATRVLEVCTEVEERSKNTQGQMNNAASAEEELVKTLQCIKQLWADGAGCDVTLEVLGGTFHGQSSV